MTRRASRPPSPRPPRAALAQPTQDRGAELAQQVGFTNATDVEVGFCDPQAPGSAARTKTPTAFRGRVSRRSRPRCLHAGRARRYLPHAKRVPVYSCLEGEVERSHSVPRHACRDSRLLRLARTDAAHRHVRRRPRTGRRHRIAVPREGDRRTRRIASASETRRRVGTNLVPTRRNAISATRGSMRRVRAN